MALAGSEADRRDEFAAALEEWLSTRSFHGPAKVSAALEYVACPIAWEDFDGATGVEAAAELSRITQERHDIVHRGQRPYIRRALAEQANTLVGAIAAHIDGEVFRRDREYLQRND
jgi:hypothetical protein